MNANYFRAAYAISTASLIIGLIMILNSSSRGQSLASAEIQRNDMMDTGEYNLLIEAGINQFLVLGGIFAASGLLIAILASFVLLIRSKPLQEDELHG